MPRLLLLVLTVAVVLGCAASPGESGPSPADRDVDGDAGSTNIRPEPEPTSFWDQSGQLLEVTVGPARRECYGPFRRMCLIVDGGYFYEEIEGFEHEPGYEYRLRILRYDPYMGQEPPQDAGQYAYRLLEVVSKTSVAGEIADVGVAPARISCPKTDLTCLLVDGEPVRGAISGFEYQAGYDHLLRVEKFNDGSVRLLEVQSQTPAAGVVEEITVGPGRVQCYTDAPITAACIVVNGEPYYGEVEDFARAHGYEYRLKVEKYDLFPDRADAPPELPKYGYRLLEVISEAAASEPVRTN